MKNNILKISERVFSLIDEYNNALAISEFTELDILHGIADELLSEMGSIENYDEVKNALVNMFLVGRMFPDENIDLTKSKK